jgi:2-hydroxychromene-2-carboxylate isomerase
MPAQAVALAALPAIAYAPARSASVLMEGSMPGPAPIDLWITMGSTYTYLTVMRLGGIEAATGARFRLRPFNLRAIFDAAGYFPFPAGSSKTAYMWRDIERRAAAYGIPIRVPAPYPARNSTLTNLITLLGLEEGWGREFAVAAYRRWFQVGQEPGTDEHVTASLRDVGQDPQRVLALVHGEHIQRLWDTETDRAREVGVFGSPTYVVGGRELFWGDDRLEDAVSWHRHRRVVLPER